MKTRRETMKADTELVDAKLKQSRSFLDTIDPMDPNAPQQYLAWHQANHADPVLGPVLKSRGITAEQSLAGVGQTTAQQIGEAGMRTAANVGETLTSGAAARASGYVGGANALTQGLGTYLNYSQGQNMLNALRAPTPSPTSFQTPGYGAPMQVPYTANIG